MYKQRLRIARRIVGGRLAALLFAAGSVHPVGSVVAEEVRVVATINPVHSLVSGVMAGIGEPHLIVRGAMSPHDFSLRPSDAGMLEDADVVFLIGEAMETSIAGPIASLAADARVVELSQIPGLVRRPLRVGGNFEDDHEHAHGAGSENDDGGDEGHRDDGADEDRGGHEEQGDHEGDAVHDEHGAFDLHVWLDPVNAQAMVRAIAKTLAEVDPANAATYEANATTIQQRLKGLVAEVAAAVQSVRGEPFVVFHDAYRYFEDRFGLVAAGSAVVSADRSPGVRRIRELRNKVRDLGVACVMTEPQFEPRLVNVIVEGTAAKAGSVDPLGATIDSGPELYFTLLRNMAASFKDCLSGSRSRDS